MAGYFWHPGKHYEKPLLCSFLIGGGYVINLLRLYTSILLHCLHNLVIVASVNERGTKILCILLECLSLKTRTMNLASLFELKQKKALLLSSRNIALWETKGLHHIESYSCRPWCWNFVWFWKLQTLARGFSPLFLLICAA